MEEEKFVAEVKRLHQQHAMECSNFFSEMRRKIREELLEDHQEEDINKMLLEMTLMFCCGELAKTISFIISEQREIILKSCISFIEAMLEECDEDMAVEDSN